jgi:hypothetical protein
MAAVSSLTHSHDICGHVCQVCPKMSILYYKILYGPTHTFNVINMPYGEIVYFAN